MVHKARDSETGDGLLLRHNVRSGLFQANRVRDPAHARCRRAERMVLAVRPHGQLHVRDGPQSGLPAPGLVQKPQQRFPPRRVVVQQEGNPHPQDESPARRPDERAEEKARWFRGFQEACEYITLRRRQPASPPSSIGFHY